MTWAIATSADLSPAESLDLEIAVRCVAAYVDRNPDTIREHREALARWREQYGSDWPIKKTEKE